MHSLEISLYFWDFFEIYINKDLEIFYPKNLPFAFKARQNFNSFYNVYMIIPKQKYPNIFFLKTYTRVIGVYLFALLSKLLNHVRYFDLFVSFDRANLIQILLTLLVYRVELHFDFAFVVMIFLQSSLEYLVVMNQVVHL